MPKTPRESRESVPSSRLKPLRQGFRKRITLPIAGFLALVLISGKPLLADPPVGSVTQNLAVIVSSSFPEKDVSLPELKRIYLGLKLFSGNVRLKTLHNKDSLLSSPFLNQVMDMTLQEFKLYCLIQLCKDGVYAPRFLNDSEIIQAVQSDSGTLGYIPLDAARAQPNLRILLVLPEASPP